MLVTGCLKMIVFMTVSTVKSSPSPRKPRLLDQVRAVLRTKHYSIRTEEAYVAWIKRFIIFHGKRRPDEMAETEIAAFLSHLANERDVAAATQNQALSALLFLYKEVLHKADLGFVNGFERPTRLPRVPVVLTKPEVRLVLSMVRSEYRLMAELLYGSGLRLMECVRLRIKDIDFGYDQITVRDGKGGKDRVTMLPGCLKGPLDLHIEKVRALHREDLARGFGS